MTHVIRTLMEFGESLSLAKREVSVNITSTVDAALLDTERTRYVSRRFSPGGYVCARFKAFERLEAFAPKMQANDAATLRLFKAGTSIHDTYQQDMLAQTKKLFGSWRCPSCGFTVHNTTQPRGGCTNSRVVVSSLGETSERQDCADFIKENRLPAWHYQEKYVYSDPLNDDAYAISGYPDGIWVNDDGSWYVLEIKSLDTLSFAAFSRVKHKEVDGQFILKPTKPRYPVQTHIAQGMVYSKLILDECRAGLLNLNPVMFKGLALIYICRDTFSTKEFHIPYTDGPYNDLLHLAVSAKRAVEAKNAMLALPRCTNADNVLAKRCPKRHICFPK